MAPKKKEEKIDVVRASRAGHSFHEYWAARRTLELVFPNDDLHAVALEGLSTDEDMEAGAAAQEIADLSLYFGDAATFAGCKKLQTLQFKYKADAGPVSASYLKKTVEKFSLSLLDYERASSPEAVAEKLTFGFVTNAHFSPGLWTAINHLKAGTRPDEKDTIPLGQYDNLIEWTKAKGGDPLRLFPMIEFRAAERNLPAHKSGLRRALTDWSSGSDGQAVGRLHTLLDLVQKKAQLEGQIDNLIRREDVLDALNCDEADLFPAETRFVDVGPVVPRAALDDLEKLIDAAAHPVFIEADGGVGKTVFVEDLSRRFAEVYEVVLFDCFGGGVYRSETQARHLPKFGLVQITNELASRGLCDPLLPSDNDSFGILAAVRRRFKQAVGTIRAQSTKKGIVLVIDAADNAQLEADRRHQESFPRLLLASLSEDPIDGVKLLLSGRPNRVAPVIARSKITSFTLPVFTDAEARRFVRERKADVSEEHLARALARSGRNARVLAYLVKTWDKNVALTNDSAPITADDLIAQQCQSVFDDLDIAGWPTAEVVEFFTALSRLPPPIPVPELAIAMGWNASEIASATSDLAPMLELIPQGAIFRDEPTETYISDHYGDDPTSQRAIVDRLTAAQGVSEYAAEVLPNLLVGIGDAKTAFALADSTSYPASIYSEYSRRRLKMSRLKAAFRLALKGGDKDALVKLLTRLSQVAAANARGDDFIRRAPGLAVKLGDRDVPRRLFNDRSGWRGARHARLTIAHTFAGELEEATYHGERTGTWINWYYRRPHHPGPQYSENAPRAHEFAALFLLAVVNGDLGLLERNLTSWRMSHSLEVLEEVYPLLRQYDKLTGGSALRSFSTFFGSDQSKSAAAKLILLAKSSYANRDQVKSLAATTTVPYEKAERSEGFEQPRPTLGGVATRAAFVSLLYASRTSASRLLKPAPVARPSAHDYGEHYGMANIWDPIFRACVGVWSAGREVTYSDLLPYEIKIGTKAKAIKDDHALSAFLAELKIPQRKTPSPPAAPRIEGKRGRPKKAMTAQFSQRERDEIVKGIRLVMELVAPLQSEILSGARGVSAGSLESFLGIWATKLRPLGPRVLEEPHEFLARTIGLRIARLMLRHCVDVTKPSAQHLIELLTANRFFVSEKIGILEELVVREGLGDVSGDLAVRITQSIKADDRIENRGTHYGDLAATLLLLSVDEARAYYRKGLAELDQMGADDYDLIYAMLRFAAMQEGGFIEPALAHRMMNLAQTILSEEPHKFAWTLFGSVAAHSIGLQAIYKMLRWGEQDVADQSYGIPQAACALAARGALDPRRAAILLLVCEDHSWWDWKIGEGLGQLLEKADSNDRAPIFSLIFEKLKLENPWGYASSRWESLLPLSSKFPGLIPSGGAAEIEALQRRAQFEADQFNHRNSHRDDRPFVRAKEPDEVDAEAILEGLVRTTDPSSAPSLEAALTQIASLAAVRPIEFLARVRKVCPYDKRLSHMLALCEIPSFDIQDSFWRLQEAMEEWKTTTSSVADNAKTIIGRLLQFKTSDLFASDLSGSLDREIHRLSEFCGDRIFVIDAILSAVAGEQDDLTGEEWLALAAALSPQASQRASREALEAMLADPAARLADEIGEGAFRPEFEPKASSEPAFMADIFWNLLGRPDAYIKWPAARALKGMARLGLVDDLRELLSRFDDQGVLALTSKDNPLPFQNSQQWLLMGLARASLHEPEALLPLRGEFVSLASRGDVHIINRLQLSRILSNLPGGRSDPFAVALAKSLAQPPKGYVTSDKFARHEEAKIAFRFDYDFDRKEIENLARLVSVPKGEAQDAAASEVLRRWPGRENMDFIGRQRYHAERNDRYEFFREHVQRHALLSAATRLLEVHPVRRASYDTDDVTPYDDWLKRYDLTPSDGSFLSDHKDAPPPNARVYLQGRSASSQPALRSQDDLLRETGLIYNALSELPLFGSWKSPDDVYVRITAGLGKRRGIIGACEKFIKRADYELWLPLFGQDGEADTDLDRSPFEPLIWDPEFYHTGVDQTDEFAIEDVMARPRLGAPLALALKLARLDEGKRWLQADGAPALRSQVWGQFEADPNDQRGGHHSNKGSILWADRVWLPKAAAILDRSIVQIAHFVRYKASRFEEDIKTVKAVFVLLHRPDGTLRVWPAKKAMDGND